MPVHQNRLLKVTTPASDSTEGKKIVILLNLNGEIVS